MSSDPAAESRVAHLPRQIELRFSDTVNAAQVTLIDPAGGTVELGAVSIRNDIVRTSVPVPDGAPGRYAVSYTTTSTDGRAGNGSLSFTVTTGVKPSPTKGGAKSPTPTAAATTAEAAPTSAAAAPADFRTGGPNPGAGPVVAEPQSERPAWWTFAAVLLVVACVLVVFMGFSRRRIRPPVPPRNPANSPNSAV